MFFWPQKLVPQPPSELKMETIITGSIFEKSANTLTMETTGENRIGKLFRPIIILLRIVGYSPLSYSPPRRKENDGRVKGRYFAGNFVLAPAGCCHDDDNPEGNATEKAKKMEYRLTFKSWYFLWALAIAIFCILSKLLTLLGIHTVYEMSWWSEVRLILSTQSDKLRSEGQEVVKTMMWAFNLLRCVAPLVSICETIFSWTESCDFAKFLNNWTQFENQFFTIFPSSIDPIDSRRVERLRNILLILYVFLPSATLTILSASVISKDDIVSLILGIFLLIPFVLQTLCASLLEDTKAILTYASVADAFGQIKNGISHILLKEKMVTAGTVRSWRQLVYQVRGQVLLAGKYQKCHQLLLIIGSITQLTLLSFLLLIGSRVSTTTSSIKLTVQGTCVLVVMTGRIYLKISAADKITRNESFIVHELERIDTSNIDLVTQLEIKNLHDMIKLDRSQISFGGYVTLNKKLLLKIFGQIVTYLIVLMQFSQTSRLN